MMHESTSVCPSNAVFVLDTAVFRDGKPQIWSLCHFGTAQGLVVSTAAVGTLVACWLLHLALHRVSSLGDCCHSLVQSSTIWGLLPVVTFSTNLHLFLYLVKPSPPKIGWM